MKIQCQNCAKIYLVAANQISESGRKVKCTNCHYTWHEYLQETPNESSITNTQEKKGSNRGFLQNLAFTALAFVATTGLCFVIANDIFPNKMEKVYKTINTYKDSISYKLGYKKEKENSSYMGRLTANKFYQDYLFLSYIKSS